MKEIVSLVKCSDYEIDNVRIAMKSLLDNLGGLDKFVKKDQKVLIKANLLNNFKVETATTTNPVAVQVLAEMLEEIGALVTIGDSSAGLYNKFHMTTVYKAAKMTTVAENTNAKLNDDFDIVNCSYPEGVVAKNFDIIKVALDADVIINFGKVKTHSFTFFTGAVKNLFGLIPGMQKAQVHAESPKVVKFMNYVVDIGEFMKDKIALHILDGVVGMEGPGPSAGTPRKIERFIASTNPFACDLVAVKIIGGEIEHFPEFHIAKVRGIVPHEESQVEIVGETLESSIIKDYILVDNDLLWNDEVIKATAISKRVQKWITAYPTVKKSQCKGCKKCQEHCPNDAITMVKGVAKFDLDLCIRCFCCQELCPYHVIKIKRSWLSKILRKM